MKFTHATLVKLECCRPQLDRFRELFGDEVEVTEELLVHHSERFWLSWLASRLFFGEVLTVFSMDINIAIKRYREDWSIQNSAAHNAYHLAIGKAFWKAWITPPIVFIPPIN